jgi:hypothetical protein
MKKARFVIMSILLAFSIGLCSCAEKTKQAEVKKPHTLVQLWEKQASEHGLEEGVIRNVSDLCYQVKDVQGYQKRIESKAIEKSLDRYLKQFKRSFINSNTRREACFSIAWLLVQCEKRPQPTFDELRESRAWFEGFKNKSFRAVDENIINAIGHEGLLKYKDQIEQTHASIGQRLDYYFNEFHDDPLFPLFKKPLSNSVEEKVLQRIKEDEAFKSSVKKGRMPEEEYIPKYIEKSFRYIDREIINFALLYSNRSEWEKEKYWGGMLHSLYSLSSDDKGVWPAKLLLRHRLDGFVQNEK